MEFKDRVLKCIGCARDFVFSAGEQVYFRDKLLQNVPKRCKPCKAKLTKVGVRAETSVNCAECGVRTTVPFLPHLGRPVLCRSCFKRHRNEGSPVDLDVF
jgi:CxxC-x17-CxxC domain-containing protein